MISGYLKCGDIVYNPFLDEIYEIIGFNNDEIGQRAIVFRVGKKKLNKVTAWVVFKYFIPLTQDLK